MQNIPAGSTLTTGRLSISVYFSIKYVSTLIFLLTIISATVAQPVITGAKENQIKRGKKAEIELFGRNLSELTSIDSVFIGGYFAEQIKAAVISEKKIILTVLAPEQLATGTYGIEMKVTHVSHRSFLLKKPSPDITHTGLEISYKNSRIPNGWKYVQLDTVKNGLQDFFTFQLKNSGQNMLRFSGIQMPNGFELLEKFPSHLPQGAISYFHFQLTTAKAGTYGGQIIITETNGNQFRFSVTGTVLKPRVKVLKITSGTQNFSVRNSDPLEFLQSETDLPSTKSISFENTLNKSVEIKSVSLPEGFSVAESFPFEIQPNTSASLTIEFDGNSSSGTISFQTNGESLHIPVSGRRVAVVGSNVLISPAEIRNGKISPVEFGAIISGEPQQRTIVFPNNSNKIIQLANTALPPGFRFLEKPPKRINPGENAMVTVEFNGDIIDRFGGDLVLDVDMKPFRIPLRARVAALARTKDVIEFSADGSNALSINPIDFGRIPPGKIREKLLMISNNGSEPRQLQIADLPAVLTTGEFVPGIIPPFAKEGVLLRFSSDSTGDFSGSFKLKIDGNIFSVPFFAFCGRESLPPVSISIDDQPVVFEERIPIDLGILESDSSTMKTIVVTNNGTEDLPVALVSISSGYSLQTAGAFTLTAGESRPIIIRFRSKTAGRHDAEIMFAVNDSRLTFASTTMVAAPFNPDKDYGWPTGETIGLFVVVAVLSAGLVYGLNLVPVLKSGITALSKIISAGETVTGSVASTSAPAAGTVTVGALTVQFKTEMDFGTTKVLNKEAGRSFELRLKPIRDPGSSTVKLKRGKLFRHEKIRIEKAPQEIAGRNRDIIGVDDLTKIEGIGPKISVLLNAAGISTYAHLAATDSEQLHRILYRSKIYIADPATWPRQAGLASGGKWAKLKTLQRRLKGGRSVKS